MYNVKKDLRASTNLKPTFQEKRSQDQQRVTFQGQVTTHEYKGIIKKKKGQIKVENYKNPNLDEIVAQQTHITADQRKELGKLLHKHKRVFQYRRD